MNDLARSWLIHWSSSEKGNVIIVEHKSVLVCCCVLIFFSMFNASSFCTFSYYGLRQKKKTESFPKNSTLLILLIGLAIIHMWPSRRRRWKKKDAYIRQLNVRKLLGVFNSTISEGLQLQSELELYIFTRRPNLNIFKCIPWLDGSFSSWDVLEEGVKTYHQVV